MATGAVEVLLLEDFVEERVLHAVGLGLHTMPMREQSPKASIPTEM
jgi:hypothetical protein